MMIVSKYSRLERGCICPWEDSDSRVLGMTWKGERVTWTLRISKASFDQSEDIWHGISRYDSSPSWPPITAPDFHSKFPFDWRKLFSYIPHPSYFCQPCTEEDWGEKKRRTNDKKNKIKLSSFQFNSQDDISRFKCKLWESWLDHSIIHHLPFHRLISTLFALTSSVKYTISYIDFIHKMSLLFF